MASILKWALLLGGVASWCGADEVGQFRCVVLSEDFHSEGANFADFNGDGHYDVVSGPFWYEGPLFRRRHRYAEGNRFSIKAYSNHFFSFPADFNGDQRPDILVIAMPGQAAWWYENPGPTPGVWQRHHVLDDVGSESPAWTDLTGDGKPELITIHDGALGYAQPDPEHPDATWTFTPISARGKYGAFTHGLGVGDVDGDQRLDLLETRGWHQQPPSLGNRFSFHEQRFAESGGAQMFAYDFDGDGDQDVVSVQNAHAWGLTWFERRGQADDFLWIAHPILTAPQSDSPPSVTISQMHAVALADIDHDGVKDIVTGKRYFAHGGNDPGAAELPVLYWFRTRRLPGGGVEFEPHLIDRRVGVGTQLTAGDIDKDGDQDLVIGNKLGTFVLFNDHTATQPARQAANLAGTADFSLGVRTSEPLSPTEELQTFVLPHGFEAQLVASEPDIAKPLNMAFDARGRLWVTNTLEYPYPVEVGQPGRDSIRILEDLDSDGRADKIVTFADGLNIPMGLYPYRDGVICYSIPNIWFLRDTDGDGVCDRREKLYGPFDHTRDTHGMCNAFTRGFDGWLYACHGFNNQSQVAGADGHQVTMHSGNTFRMRLDGSRVEHFTYGQVNPFGMAYDRRGDLLTADCHTKPVTLLLAGGYYESFGKPHDGLGFVPAVMDHLHGSTAIGGIAVTTSQEFPGSYRDNSFGGNVMTSRINRNSLRYEGGSLRAQEEPDFLIAGDAWFRPVDLQIGPDGALYVADFYNRIIGHYEVPLTHPGRDRHRGRIWRISYRGHGLRPGEQQPANSGDAVDLTQRGLDELLAIVGGGRPTLAKLAADRLVDVYGGQAVQATRTCLREDGRPQSRWQCLWILYRLQAITDDEIQQALDDAHPLVRAHACRVLAAVETKLPQRADWIAGRLKDEDRFVQRCAAHTAARHVDAQLMPELMDAYQRSPAEDVHLRHSLRLAMRNHLQDPAVRSATLAQVGSQHVELLAGICLAIETPDAAEFVLRHMDRWAEDRTKLVEYASFAARYGDGESLATLTDFARRRFDQDLDLQRELLDSILRGIRHRGGVIPSVVRQWATAVATQLLAVSRPDAPLPWQSIASGKSDGLATWRPSRRRRSADGMTAIPLWSSFPGGEQRTGILRSASFQLPPEFSFFMAGHDGIPDKPPQGKNVVRVRDRQTHEVLQAWQPPRNDVAQHYTWHCPSLADRQVYVELVDDDPGAAYAWLAVGRFSDPRLNPSDLQDDRRLAATMVADFRLVELRPQLFTLLKNEHLDSQSRVAFARAIAGLQSRSIIKAVGELFAVESLTHDLRSQAIRVLQQQGEGEEVLSSATKFATLSEQLGIAEQLAADAAGCRQLVAMCESGQLNPRLLAEPRLRANFMAVAASEVQQRAEVLLTALGPEDESLESQLSARVHQYFAGQGDRARGQQLFQKHCAACHQIAGQGKQVGPNLDGIGNRGLQRLTEDVLAPSRNVDHAFRAMTLVTSDGRAVTGLVRGPSGARYEVVDTAGQEISIAVDAVELKKPSTISPMPANFGELLDANEFRDLMNYLLHVR